MQRPEATGHWLLAGAVGGVEAKASPAPIPDDPEAKAAPVSTYRQAARLGADAGLEDVPGFGVRTCRHVLLANGRYVPARGPHTS